MTPLHQSRDMAGLVAERVRLYAQPQRLMILSFLLEGEQSVGAIDVATGVGQPALSQQLAELRHAGLLASRRAADYQRREFAARHGISIRSVERKLNLMRAILSKAAKE